MKPIIRIAGIIIQDGKILMLKGKGYKELWTPGGKIKEGENDEECLNRELQEEIGVTLASSKLFREYPGKSFYNPEIVQNEKVYIATISGEIKPDAEIESFIWLTKKDFEIKKYPMITNIQDQIIPDLFKVDIW